MHWLGFYLFALLMSPRFHVIEVALLAAELENVIRRNDVNIGRQSLEFKHKNSNNDPLRLCRKEEKVCVNTREAMIIWQIEAI